MRKTFLKPRLKSEKTTEVEKKPPDTRHLPSVLLPDDHPKPRVNISYNEVLKEFVEY